MPRTRTIYNNEALLVGPSPATGTQASGLIKRIHRVQTLGNSYDVAYENINEFGKLAAIDRLNVDGAESAQDFSYFVTDFENELALGFAISSTSSAIGSILDKSQDDRNYFRAVAPEGVDAEGLAASAVAVMAVGNGFISSYAFEAAVGGFPTATVSVQGLNTQSYADGVAKANPAVDPSTGRLFGGTFTLPLIPAASAVKPTAIKPGAVKVTFSNPNAGVFQVLDSTVAVQSAGFNFDLNLEALNKLGSRMAFSREIQFPVDIQVSLEVLQGDLTSNTGLVNFLCSEPKTDITIDLYKDGCDAGGPTSLASDIFAKYIIKNVKMTSQDFSSTIGPSNTVSMEFLGQVGASNDTLNGIFFSGVTGYSGATALKSL